ncbi:MAG: PIG-L family deacetylase [Elusimicrobiota bacterium]
MEFKNKTAELYIPDGKPETDAVKRTTHIALSAHQDDIEIMAYHGVLECFGQIDKWFFGVTVTDGAGSARDNIYKNFTDDDMKRIRKNEQKKAAYVGEYGAMAMLNYTSSQVKDAVNPDVIADIKTLLLATRPKVVYTHNLADKHDTHVSVALRTITALRSLPADAQPEKVLGCEVWRDLDWMIDSDKVALNVQAHENLAAALLGVFDSQICGGKRYDLATVGRRRAHATYHASHGVDDTTGLTFAMDLTPLVKDKNMDITEYVNSYLSRFMSDVSTRVNKFAGK